MRAFIPPLAGSRAFSRSGLLALAAAVLAGLLWAHGPIGQWADYHAFADRRAWLGLPNAADVLSNLPFLAAGAWAVWRMAGWKPGLLPEPPEAAPEETRPVCTPRAAELIEQMLDL